MSRIECEREQEIVDAIQARRWPQRAHAELRQHAESCPICRDVAAIATAIHDDCEAGWTERRVPSAAHLWWRAQLRARHEAAAAASQPIVVAQGLAAASTVGLGIGAIGYGLATARWSDVLDIGAWRLAAGGLASDVSLLAGSVPVLAVALGTALAAIVLMPLALYFVFSDK